MTVRNRLTIILNCIIAIDVALVAATRIVLGAGEGQLGTYIIGLGYFKPYTMDSNILAGIVALLIVIHSIKNKRGDGKKMPRWLMRAYLMGTTCLVLTFLVAAAFFAPMEVISGRSYLIMFTGDMFFCHFINPLLATVSLIVLLRDSSFSAVDRFLGIIPTIVYSIVYFVMVAVLKWWDDFYNFTFGGRYYLIPVVAVVIYGIAYLISYMLIRQHNRYVNLGDNF